MAVIIWDIEIIHLPGALVVGHVSPLDQIMHIPIFIKTARNKHHQKEELKVSLGSVLSLTIHFLGLNTQHFPCSQYAVLRRIVLIGKVKQSRKNQDDSKQTQTEHQLNIKNQSVK